MSIADIKEWYLAGPMSNIPQFNVPAFLEAAEELRARGLTIYLPDNLDDPAAVAQLLLSPDGAHGAIDGPTWGECLAEDIKIVTDKADGIILLPGWEESPGARLETYVGKMLCGKPVVFYPDLIPVPDYVLHGAWLGQKSPMLTEFSPAQAAALMHHQGIRKEDVVDEEGYSTEGLVVAFIAGPTMWAKNPVIPEGAIAIDPDFVLAIPCSVQTEIDEAWWAEAYADLARRYEASETHEAAVV